METKDNNSKKRTPYNGSTNPSITWKAIKTLVHVDKNMKRLETRREYLNRQRHDLEVQFNSTNDAAEKATIIEKDEAIDAQFAMVIEKRNTLLDESRKIVEAMGEKIRTYSFEDLTW